MNIKVDRITAKKLFRDYNLNIPDYQRFYVWDKENVEDLLNDLKEFFSITPNGQYYLGSILLHKDKKYHNIIDGQQRIITLLILSYVIKRNDKIINKLKLTKYFYNKTSMENIRNNFNLINKLDIKFLDKNILNKLYFVIIITKCEDDAFTFFDTQNGRGMRLDDVDYLKAYHLRECKSNEIIKQNFAENWDIMNSEEKIYGERSLSFLFSKILWRARRWRGFNFYFEDNTINNRSNILKEFQKNTKKNSIKYHNIIDFKLRQPIYKGEEFFYYTKYYYKLYYKLFHNKCDDNISVFQNFYSTVYSNISNYLIQLFELLCIIYYDKYKEDGICRFALYIDCLLGYYRIEQGHIKKQTIKKIIEEDKNENIIDVILSSFEKEEIFDFIARRIGIIIDNLEGKEEKYENYNYVKMEYIKKYINFLKKNKKTQRNIESIKNNIYNKIFQIEKIIENLGEINE